MKIGIKLIIMIVTLNILGISILVGTILGISHRQINTLTVNEVTNLAEVNAREIQVWLEVYMDAVRTISQIMEEYDLVELSDRRSLFSMMIRSLVEKNAEVVGASSCWEPNALDGLDAQYVNTQESDATGRFIPYWYKIPGGVSSEGLVGYETPGDGDWYLVPRRTGEEVLVDPYRYMVNGVEVLMTTVSAPIKNDGRFLGVVTGDLELTTIQQIVQKIKPYEGSVSAVFSNSGVVCAHFDPGRIGKPMAETERDVAGPYLAELMNAIQNGVLYTFSNNGMYYISSPLNVGKTTTPWALMIGIPETVLTASTYRMLFIGIIISVGMISITAITAFFIARSISRPLGYMITMFNDIGEGDLTKRLDIKSRDEIGEMTHSFNGTLDKIEDLIGVIKDRASNLSEIGTELQTNMNQTAAAINQITANIQNMKTQATNQSASVSDTGASMEKITGNINELNLHIDRQTESVSRSSSAIEEMLANIQSVTGTLVKNTDNVKDLSEASELGHSGLRDVSTDIQEIARESEGLLEINAVMENIASQTNLLSMNAAIEAAHAGEAGKGFAVVADEIRKLAESSGEQSKTISDVLKKIKASIDKIIKSTDVVLNRFEAIDRGVQTVSQQEENIRSAMEEQGEGSKQILEAVSQLNEITGMVKQGSSEMLSGSQEVITESKTLESISLEISRGMQEMAAGADQINSAVNRVNEFSGDNKHNIEALINEVSKFKVEEKSG
jgi:methyl-accepting chemotaxis protein